MGNVPNQGADYDDSSNDDAAAQPDPNPPPVRRVSFTERKEDLDRVGSLFDDSTQSSVDPKGEREAPPVDDRTAKHRRSRREDWNERRARRNQRAQQIQRRQQGDRTHARRPQNIRYNLIAVFFFVATLAAVAYLAVLWVNPQSSLNPFPPATPLPIFVTATPDGTSNTEAEDNINGGESSPVVPQIQFVQSGEVSYRAHVSCDYASIAGNIDSPNGAGYAVRISGGGLDSGVFSGSMLEYGRGGFEFQVAQMPTAGTFIVQLFTTDEIPVSDQIVISTRATCEENVAFIQFVEGNPR